MTEYRLMTFKEIKEQSSKILVTLYDVRHAPPADMTRTLEKHLITAKPNIIGMFFAGLVMVYATPKPKISFLIKTNIIKKDELGKICKDENTLKTTRTAALDIIGLLKLMEHAADEYQGAPNNNKGWILKQGHVELLSKLSPAIHSVTAVLVQLAQIMPDQQHEHIRHSLEV